MTFTLFSLNDNSGAPKYVGVTASSIRKRLQDLQSGAMNNTTNQYKQPVSVWLRDLYAEFKQPAVVILGEFDKKEDANVAKAEFIAENKSVLNSYSKPLTGFKL